MNLGILAYSSNNGLGIQTQALVKHLKPFKVMQVDLSSLNSAKQYPERLPGSQIVQGYPKGQDIEEFLQDLDCVMVAETPLNYHLFSRARELGIKTVQIPNWEFFDYFWYPNHPKPDLIISPSMWHYDDLKKFCKQHGIKLVYLHHPVDRDDLPLRQIKQARTFLHIAGRAAAHDRNGTNTVIEAGKYIKSDAKVLIHFQGEQGMGHQSTSTLADYVNKLAHENVRSNVTIRVNEFDNYADVYRGGDVLLLPRRYGGNCLPLNEALSCGMPVIMPDISPNDHLLPRDWLLPAKKISEFTPRTVIDIYGVDPKVLAAKIDEMAGYDTERMKDESMVADALAQEISWETMAPAYWRELNELCTPS